MEKNKEFIQGEKLSHCLDQLNDGNCPAIADQEIEELIEMAAVVQQSYTQNEVPRLLIDKIVTNLATELGEKKRKRRGQWLYGGLACAAATLLLVIGTQQLLPQSLNQNIAQEIDGSPKVETMVAVADQGNIPASRSSKSIIEEPVKEVSSEKELEAVPTGETSEKPTDSISNVLVEIIQVAQATPEVEKDNQVAMLAQKVPQEKAMVKSFGMARMRMDVPIKLATDSQTNVENIMLVQPNKVAKTITVDSKSGVIRQVYTDGIDENVIITQRRNTDNVATPQVISQKDKKESNSLTVKFEKYSITVEGNKTTAELKKIVDSLVVKKIEE